jgi:hypothetical protein
MNLLLLRDQSKCPQCRRHSVGHDHCWNCGIRLFRRPIHFAQWDADGNDARYWLWTNDQGWIFADHVRHGLKPLDRHVDLSLPEPNIKSAQERIEEVRQKTRRQIKSITPRRNQVGYGKSKTRLS